MTPARRARSDEQKQQRRQAILDAAWAMFQAMPYETITMAQLAADLGLAKGTLYLYYASKEELFLEVLAQQLGAWLDALDQAIRETTLTIPKLASLITDSVVQQPDFARLLSMLQPVIEPHVAAAPARIFKLFLRDRLGQTGTLIEAHLPSLGAVSGINLMLWSYALLIGFKHLSELPPTIRTVLDDPTIAMLAVDFESAFRAALTAMMLGLER